MCWALPRGATRHEDSHGYTGCSTGDQCGDGYFCSCGYDGTGFDCNDEDNPPECVSLSTITDVLNPTAVADGPSYTVCTRGADCADGEWCNCLFEDVTHDWDCGALTTQCLNLEPNMTRVEDGPGYYRCHSAEDCGPGQYCNCQGGSSDVDLCSGDKDDSSVCTDLHVGFVAARANGPGELACDNGTYSDVIPGVSGGEAGCLACQSGRFSPAGAGEFECTVAKKGHRTNAQQNGELPCDPGTFASLRGLSACSDCLPGTYTSTPGSHFCNCTEAGYIPNVDGSDEDPCPAGTYSEECMSECVTCGAGRFVFCSPPCWSVARSIQRWLARRSRVA